MKILTIQQPWAWAIIHGGKNIENRTWYTTHRGPLAIQASARPRSRRTFEQDRELAAHRSGLAVPALADLASGGLVGVVNVVDCVKAINGKLSGDSQHHVSIWFEGPYGFVLRDARPLPFVECRGMLGLWTPDATLLARLGAIDEYKEFTA